MYDWLQETAKQGEQFDIVFSSYGTVCWISDLKLWAKGIADVLKSGGRFVLVDFHPVVMMFDVDWSHKFSYFSLPKKLTKYFQVMVLLDTGFGSVEFIHGVRKRKYHVIAGIACTRKLMDGRCVSQLHKRGQQLHLNGLKFPVYVSWYYLNVIMVNM